MKQKLLILILVLSLVLGCAFALGSCVDKGNEYLERAQINLYLQENGDLKVEERWDVTVNSDSIHNLYREIELYDKDNVHYSEIKDFSVKNNLTGEILAEAYDLKNPTAFDNDHLTNHSYVYSVKTASGKVSSAEVGFYMPYTNNADLSYTMSYTLTDMVVAYNDTVVLYYKPFSTDFSLYIEDIELNLYLPGCVTTTPDTLVFLHTEIADSFSEVKADKVQATGGGFEEDNYFEIRALLPKDLFSGVVKSVSENGRESIINQEANWLKDYEESVIKERRTTVAWAIAGGVLVLLSIALALYFKVFYFKVKDKDGIFPEYVRVIPEGVTPAEMAHYFYHYKGGMKNQKNRGNVLSATIMDLTRKGFLELSPDPSDGDDYVINILTVPEPKRAELKSHEVALLELLGKVYSSLSRPFNMKDFEHYSKQNATYTNNQINKVVANSGTEFRQASNFNQSKLTLLLSMFGALLMLFGIMCFGAPLMTYGAFGAFISGLIIVIFTPRAKKFSAEGLKKYMEAQGLQNFMLDFSNLKEHEIPALILWEEYMVFATMMGISEKVLDELKLKYPELSEPTSYATYHGRSYLYFYVYMNHRHLGFDLGRSLNTTLGNISRSTNAIVQAAKAQSSGGGSFGRSGGGFRGGGGGFGGGGGGAR